MLSSRKVVTDPRAAAVFATPARRHLLFAFIGRERTLAEAARETGMSLGLLHYHVGRLVRFGLLAETGQVPRAGRPMKTYAAAAEAFSVPAELLDGGPGFGLRRELGRVLDRQDAAAEASWVFDRNEAGGMRMRRQGGAKRTVEYWRLMALDEAALGEMAGELEALLRRYGERPAKRGAKRHLVHALAIPWEGAGT